MPEHLTIAPPPYRVAPDTWAIPGLFDDRTGFYWAADCFASFVDGPGANDVAELDPGFWRESSLQLNRIIAPWHTLVDPARFDGHVDKVASLPITAMMGAHGTVMRGAAVDQAIGLVREAARMDDAPLPGQPDLEAMLATAASA